jgi:hypothetical protein
VDLAPPLSSQRAGDLSRLSRSLFADKRCQRRTCQKGLDVGHDHGSFDLTPSERKSRRAREGRLSNIAHSRPRQMMISGGLMSANDGAQHQPLNYRPPNRSKIRARSAFICPQIFPDGT